MGVLPRQHENGANMRKPAKDRLSVLIAAYKNVMLVRRCLDSLLSVFGGTLPETVLVDDAAGDPDMRALADEYVKFGLKFVVMPKNGGFAGANNFGYPLCTKEYVVLVNSDVMFREDSLSPLVAFLDSHPKAGIVQGTLVIKNGESGVDGSLNGCGAFLTWAGVNTPLGWLAPVESPIRLDARRCFAAYGAMFMIRRGVVESMGGLLFHDFFHTYYEEVNLCHRAWLAGWEVWYAPTPIAEHVHCATTGKYCLRKTILKKFYRNIRFSYLTCFGWRGLLTVYPIFEILALGQAILPLFKLRAMHFCAHAWAWWNLLKMAKTILRTRRRIQSSRKICDKDLFKIIMRPYPLKEFLNAVRGSF